MPDTKPGINIDGKNYQAEDLSNEAKAMLVNLKGTDDEIARLKQRLVIAQTARQVFAEGLRQKLPQ